ncbi:hypothetical protein GGR88_002118 [Sphingomonas jejuensis]|uniref:DUF4893 domain-containing protein n=1 Tax=Sphingomonas jejuensis TaxID=904715 RepID=A0ABX0XMK5_9SPHN|nr:DUF4893 domain-containing protein [Sphingomonas jejuensis]NJC34604.1 hypothetical protein [Sphingomonas jejuensis]
MIRGRALSAAAMLALASCAGADRPPPAARASGAGLPADDWRRYATDADRARLRGWRTAFVAGLAQARAAGHAADLDSEGALMVPDAGEPDAALPPGDYRCRVTKLGSRGGSGGLTHVAYPYFRCRVGAGDRVQSFEKLTGSQRQVGALYGDVAARRIFLGTLALGSEQRALRYGADADRDLIGVLQRIGDRRWRLLFPSPRYESLIDVMEIVPE